jgi:hypothetical protein
MDEISLRHRSPHSAYNLTRKESHTAPADRKEISIEWPGADHEEEDSYWDMEKVISTEDIIHENDRISLSIADFDERSLPTFQLDGADSSVDVHLVRKSGSFYQILHLQVWSKVH